MNSPLDNRITALVTGGAGFIGSHLVRRLVDKGFEVIVLDNLSSGSRRNIPKPAAFVYGDVRDSRLVGTLVKKSDIVLLQDSRDV